MNDEAMSPKELCEEEQSQHKGGGSIKHAATFDLVQRQFFS